MSDLAVTKEGKSVFAHEFDESKWQQLKQYYSIGDFLMPCCMSPAIPKTSPNFVQFFAHYSEECESSPESIWHIKTKEDVCLYLKNRGIPALLEYSSQSPSGKWKADIYFEHDGRHIAIEIQKSYQSLRSYLARQEKYTDGGVESYWLLYKSRYETLVKSLVKLRLKSEFGGKFPPEGYLSPCLPELPVAYYDTDEEHAVVKGASFFECSLEEWIDSLVNNRFQCVGNVWKII